MAEEETRVVEGEPQGTPPAGAEPQGQAQEPEWASQEVEVYPGKKMRLADLPKSYAEAERRMHEATTKASEYQKEIDRLAWAKQIQERYYSDPDFRASYDRIWQGDEDSPRQPNVLAPEMQELYRQRAELEQLRFERSFEKLKAQGKSLSPDDELKILGYIRDGKTSDVETAYKALFYERDVKSQMERASTQTAEHFAEARSQYAAPPKGSAPKGGKPDVRDMSKEERENRILDAIKRSGLSFSGE